MHIEIHAIQRTNILFGALSLRALLSALVSLALVSLALVFMDTCEAERYV